MKKYLFFLSSAAVLLSSCSDEFAPNTGINNGNYNSIAYATLETNADPQTRFGVSVNTTTNKYKFDWDLGDALGVFNPKGLVDNAQFAYNTNTEVFTSQSFIAKGETYYAYYPYSNPAPNNSDATTLNLNLNSNQNFNWFASSANEDNTYYPDKFNPTTESGDVTKYGGSFSNGAVPAVATSVATENNEIKFTLQPLASYIVVPMTGMGEVSSISFKLKAPSDTEGENVSGGYYILDGSYAVTWADLDENGINGENNGIEWTNGTSTAITLNCGNVELDPYTPINFWFVVPSGLQIVGSVVEMNVTLASDGDPIELESSPLTATGYETYTLPRNTIIPVTDSGQPFECVDPNSFMMTTGLQFLEYANLITNGTKALTGYSEFTGNQAALSNLQKMLPSAFTGETFTAPENLNGLLTPIIMKDLELSPDAIYDAIVATLYPDDPSAAPRVITLPNYFNYLETYVNDGYFDGSIGGQVAYTISGFGETAGLNGLVVNGNGLFNFGEYTTSSVSGLTLQNVIVNAANEDGTYFISEQNNGINVNVGQNNALNYKNTAVPDAAYYQSVNASVFASATTTPNTEVVTPFTKYATDLIFTENYNLEETPITLASFTNVIVAPTDGTTNPVITVTDSSAAEEFITMAEFQANSSATTNNSGYSVIDSQTVPTSYWTGTSYQTSSDGNIYAENLYYARLNGTSASLTLTNNLDLGEKYNMIWPAIGSSTKALSVNGVSKYSIQNVNINVNEDVYKNPTVFTLLGQIGGAQNVTINNIIISNGTEEDSVEDAYVGIIAVTPSSTAGKNITNVTIDGTVEINLYGSLKYPAGGFLQSLPYFGPTSELKIGTQFVASTNTYANSATIDFNLNGNKFGYIAGSADLLATDDDTNELENWFALNIPTNSVNALNGYNAYGQLGKIYVPVASENTPSAVYLTVGTTGLTSITSENIDLMAIDSDATDLTSSALTTYPTINVRFMNANSYPEPEMAQGIGNYKTFMPYTYSSNEYSWNGQYLLVNPATGEENKALSVSYFKK